MTPVEKHGDVLVKREDLFTLHGVNGSKLRQALALLEHTNADGIVGWGGRRSTTAAAISAAAKELGASASFHTATGQPTLEMDVAERLGCKIHRHRPGYLNVLRARATAEATSNNWALGLEHPACVYAVASQVGGLLCGPERIVVACGSCVVLAGIVEGFQILGWSVPVLAVRVGAPLNSTFLDRYAPWWRFSDITAVQVDLPYAQPAKNARLGDLLLDPLYEGKTLPYLQKGDLLWNSGIRTQ